MSDNTSNPSAQPTSGTGQDPETAPKPTAPPSAPATPSGGQEATATIARLESELAAARAEAGKQRVSAKQKAADEARTQLAQDIGRALGLVEDDTPPDPTALTQQLAAEQQRARATAVELAVFRTAPDVGADAEALLDSRAFATAVADLEPADTAAVQAAIEAAVTANPKLAAQPAGPTRGGTEFTNPPAAEQRPATLRDAIAARLGG